MIHLIRGAADFAITERLARTGKDLNSHGAYEDPFVADMYRKLAGNTDPSDQGPRWDIFRKWVYDQSTTTEEADLALVPHVSEHTGDGNPAPNALVEVKPWINDARLDTVLGGFSADVARLMQRNRGAQGYFVLWAAAADDTGLGSRLAALRARLGLGEPTPTPTHECFWWPDGGGKQKRKCLAWVWQVSP